MVKVCVIRLQVIEGPNMRDRDPPHPAFSSFHSFLVEIETKLMKLAT